MCLLYILLIIMGKVSKRAQQVSLTKVKPKGKDLKTKLCQQLSAYIEIYPVIFAFSYSNFKTAPLQKLREAFTTSKFLLGKSKVLKAALSQHKDFQNLENLNKHLSGYSGLLFTKESPESMIEFFYTWSESVCLVPGQTASESIVIPKGVDTFSRFSNTIEPYLRKLGLPTRVHEGKIEMLGDFVVCSPGEVVDTEKSKILRLLNVQQGEMKIELKAVWMNGEYKELVS